MQTVRIAIKDILDNPLEFPDHLVWLADDLPLSNAPLIYPDGYGFGGWAQLPNSAALAFALLHSGSVQMVVMRYLDYLFVTTNV